MATYKQVFLEKLCLLLVIVTASSLASTEIEKVDATKPYNLDVTTTSADILKNENISAIHLIFPTDSTHFGGGHNKTVEMGNGGSTVMPFGASQTNTNVGTFKTGNTGEVEAAPIINDVNSEGLLVRNGVVTSFNPVINTFDTGYKYIFQRGSDGRYLNSDITIPLEINKITSKIIPFINKNIFNEVNRQEFTQPSQSVILSPTGSTGHSGSVPVNVVNPAHNFLEPGSPNFPWDTKPSPKFISKPYENTGSISFPNLPEGPVSHIPIIFERQGKYLDSITYNQSDAKPDSPKIPRSSDYVYTNEQPRELEVVYLHLTGPGGRGFSAQAGHAIQNISIKNRFGMLVFPFIFLNDKPGYQNQTGYGKPDYQNQFGLGGTTFLIYSKPGEFYFQNCSGSRVIDFPDILCYYRPGFQNITVPSFPSKTMPINSNFQNHIKPEVPDFTDIFVNNTTEFPSHIETEGQDFPCQTELERNNSKCYDLTQDKDLLIRNKSGLTLVPIQNMSEVPIQTKAEGTGVKNITIHGGTGSPRKTVAGGKLSPGTISPGGKSTTAKVLLAAKRSVSTITSGTKRSTTKPVPKGKLFPTKPLPGRKRFPPSLGPGTRFPTKPPPLRKRLPTKPEYHGTRIFRGINSTRLMSRILGY